MKKISIYEPSMCCPTGLCGVGVDPELLRISGVANSLKSKGIEMVRYNLSNDPMAFMTNKTINTMINEKGVEGLPATFVNGQLVLSGRYPSNEEFESFLALPENFLDKTINQDQ